MNDFAAMYEQEYQRVFAYLLVRTANWHVAEDLTSQVFLIAWRDWDEWEDRGIPYAHYLRKIAWREQGLYWAKEKRWQRRMHRYPYLRQHDLDSAIGDDGGIGAVLDRCETAMVYAMLAAALRKLRPRPLRAIALRYGAGLMEKDAARELKISTDAFHSLKRGAEERLRQILLGKEPNWTAKNKKARARRKACRATQET